jgi:phosphoenolpyruvate carboxylase
MEKLISKELSELVSWSVSILGDAIKKEYGEQTFVEVELLRKRMKKLRAAPSGKVYSKLLSELAGFKQLSTLKIHQMCNSFSLMLELVNRCETAYRAHRLESTELEIPKNKPRKIIFVLTAHPTEARSPEILGLFEEVQKILQQNLKTKSFHSQQELYHLFMIALKVSLARTSSPTVADEAHNIYSYILKDEILDSLVNLSKMGVDVSLRSWVGGDKDGHPGVDEKTLLASLEMSRRFLINYIQKKITQTLERISFIEEKKDISLITQLELLLKQASLLCPLRNSDGVRITEFKNNFLKTYSLYEKVIGFQSPDLVAVERLIWIFPALVVALEIREDSEVVKEALRSDDELAITRMLKTLSTLAHGFDKKWYVRGFVLSMVESSKDIKNGLLLTKKTLGGYDIPVVPLFENEKALTGAVDILQELFSQQKSVIKNHQKKWGGRYEVMVGYSDSSKENGVLPSRVMISSALKNIEKVLRKNALTPVFFHGSGGSIERGGGALSEQTGWWPKSAIETFKATIQGEMVARSFGSQTILAKQVQVILDQLGTYKGGRKSHSRVLKKFSEAIRASYSEKIQDDNFMEVIALATPYSFLHHLKIGSRPSKRPGGSIKNNLRAIPWVLCWTQTRILFPTWWGVGSAWSGMSENEQKELKHEYAENPVLMTYLKALGFTLAKVELGVWHLYLAESNINKELKDKTYKEFESELKGAYRFFQDITGEKDLLWFRPWLKESIDLRSAMIHPLNLCQIESLRRDDYQLLRNSVTGIACGMLTTG